MSDNDVVKAASVIPRLPIPPDALSGFRKAAEARQYISVKSYAVSATQRWAAIILEGTKYGEGGRHEH